MRQSPVQFPVTELLRGLFLKSRYCPQSMFSASKSLSAIHRTGWSRSTAGGRYIVAFDSATAEWLLVRTTWAGPRTLRYARVVYLAANYIVGIALLEPLQARLTARRW